VFGRSATFLFLRIHSGVSFVFISALVDIFLTAVRSFRGLGCPQQAFGIFARRAAQNTMLVIFVALLRVFSPELFSLLRLSLFRQRIGAVRLSFSLPSFGGIIIVNWLGAIIAQSGRQFDESGGCFFGGGVI